MPDRESVVQALKDSLRNQHCGFIDGVGNVYAVSEETINDILELLKEQPEIVRCKDCRYGQYCTDGETTYQCFKWNSNEFGALHEQDWFCADGERKD